MTLFFLPLVIVIVGSFLVGYHIANLGFLATLRRIVKQTGVEIDAISALHSLDLETKELNLDYVNGRMDVTGEILDTL